MLKQQIDQLNPQQKRAVLHQKGPALVLAGAGSGKTRVVTLRMAYLIEQGLASHQILGLTFTNKAAGEMKQRVEQLVQSLVPVSTFHSLGLKILRESISLWGFDPHFLIYDEEDTDKIIRASLKEACVTEDKADIKAVRTFISQCKNQLIQPAEMEEQEESREHNKEYIRAFSCYQKRMRQCNAVDYDDLLMLPVLLFQKHPSLLLEYQQRWPFLLIDEYQDTNHAQYVLVKLLAHPRNNVFVVGDPDQSIYSWRGANIHNILNFEADFPGAELIYLEQNYRSTQTILQAANALIHNNTNRYEKQLRSSHSKGEKIWVHIAPSERLEAQCVSDAIEQLCNNQKISFQDMAIFYRTHFQSRSIEDALIYRRIPYVVIGGVSFYQRKEIKDILAFLKCVVSATDLVSVQRTINNPKRGIGQASLEKLEILAHQAHCPLVEYLMRCIDIEWLKGLPIRLTEKQRGGLVDYARVMSRLRDVALQGSLSDVVRAALFETRYLDVLAEDPETKEERKENVEELLVKAIEWEELNPGKGISDFLEEIALLSSLDESDGVQDRVSLMTIHNGKGLEFRAVFMMGLEEDLFPHINSKIKNDQLEEERRLFYVGLTRAKEIAFLSGCSSRNMWGSLRKMSPSRFISEIPGELRQRYLGRIGFKEHSNEEKREILKEQASPVSSLSKPFFREPLTDFSLGDVVHHTDFGIGKIEQIEDSSLGKIYTVLFLKEGRARKLVAAYAPLTLLPA